MIHRRTVFALGVSQLVCWGITYYLIGVFGPAMVAELRWSQAVVYGGFSAALLVMGFASPLAGRWIDRYGGARVMTAGSVLTAVSCIALAVAHDVALYYGAWVLLGIAMRLTLYDAAFAALARMGGPEARGPIAQITLFGGLASTVFWPVGSLLAQQSGWRGAVLWYALFALLTVPLHLALPRGRYLAPHGGGHAAVAKPRAATPGDRITAGALYALVAGMASFLNSAMSSHMIGILAGLGVAASAAVWISSLRGIGQTAARLGEVMFGRRVDPLALNLAASALVPLAFLAGLVSGEFVAAAALFAFLYGAGNGVMTITRGTLPLVLFDHRTYGSVVGKLLALGFLLAAVAPLAYAEVAERFGAAGTLYVSIAVATMTLAASAVLAARFRSRTA